VGKTNELLEVSDNQSMADDRVEVEKDYVKLKLKLAEFVTPNELKKLSVAYGIPRGIGARMESILQLFDYLEVSKPLGESWLEILVKKLNLIGVQLTETENTYVISLAKPGSMLCYVMLCYVMLCCSLLCLLLLLLTQKFLKSHC